MFTDVSMIDLLDMLTHQMTWLLVEARMTDLLTSGNQTKRLNRSGRKEKKKLKLKSEEMREEVGTAE